MRDDDYSEQVSTLASRLLAQLTRHRSENARLLGDPKFPSILDHKKQGEKIGRYQELYQIYSRLALSRPYDRPTAIAGLQKRLLDTLKVQGGFGVFDEGESKGLLRRSLLWHRGPDTPILNRIDFSKVHTTVPSWSWMAYTGGIDYLNIDGGVLEWEDLESPWSQPRDGKEQNSLIAKARQFDRTDSKGSDTSLIADAGEGLEPVKGLCVVLGVRKGAMTLKSRLHFVLLIAPAKQLGGNGNQMFERIGAGHMLGRYIAEETVSVSVS